MLSSSHRINEFVLGIVGITLLSFVLHISMAMNMMAHGQEFSLLTNMIPVLKIVDTSLSFSCENLASVHNLKDDAKDYNVEHLSHKTGLRENYNLTVSWLRKLGDLYHNLPTNVQYHILNKLPVREKWPNTTICAKECLYEQEGKAPPRTSFECLFNLCITLIYIISFSKFLCVCKKRYRN